MVLDFDYIVPKTHPPNVRIPGGVVAKEAKKKDKPLDKTAPGPGEYMKPIAWNDPKLKTIGGTKPAAPVFSIPSTPRDKGLKLNKVPGVGSYETQKRTLDQKRVLGGNITKGPKRSFIDAALQRGPLTPGPCEYKIKHAEDHVPALPFSPPKSESRKEGKSGPSPGPGHFKISYELVEKRSPRIPWNHKVEKNFVDKLVLLNKSTPAVGQYEQVKLDKIGRGCRVLQLNPTLSPKMKGAY